MAGPFLVLELWSHLINFSEYVLWNFPWILSWTKKWPKNFFDTFSNLRSSNRDECLLSNLMLHVIWFLLVFELSDCQSSLFLTAWTFSSLRSENVHFFHFAKSHLIGNRKWRHDQWFNSQICLAILSRDMVFQYFHQDFPLRQDSQPRSKPVWISKFHKFDVIWQR